MIYNATLNLKITSLYEESKTCFINTRMIHLLSTSIFNDSDYKIMDIHIYSDTEYSGYIFNQRENKKIKFAFGSYSLALARTRVQSRLLNMQSPYIPVIDMFIDWLYPEACFEKENNREYVADFIVNLEEYLEELAYMIEIKEAK